MKQPEFQVPRKPLPSRSAYVSTEPTAPARYSRRKEMLHKNITEESKSEDHGETRFSQTNSFHSVTENISSQNSIRSINSNRLIFLKGIFISNFE